jgi:tripartite-type tricarboxylate transporter receptor subunit TctC
LRVLGVIGSERGQLFPDVPTFAEALPLPGYAVNAWIGMAAPVKTPVAVVNRLSGEFKKMLSDPAFVQKTVTPQGFEVWHQTPADTTKMFRGELEKYTKVMKDLGLKIID